MTREQFSQGIQWSWISWGIGLVNVTAMIPQLIKLVATHETSGIAIGMFWIYLLVQIGLALDGFFKRNKMLFWCMAASGLLNAITICLYYTYRP